MFDKMFDKIRCGNLCLAFFLIAFLPGQWAQAAESVGHRSLFPDQGQSLFPDPLFSKEDVVDQLDDGISQSTTQATVTESASGSASSTRNQIRDEQVDQTMRNQ